MSKREERLRFLAEGAQNRVSSRLGDIWWAFMLRGVFAGVLGHLRAHLWIRQAAPRASSFLSSQRKGIEAVSNSPAVWSGNR